MLARVCACSRATPGCVPNAFPNVFAAPIRALHGTAAFLQARASRFYLSHIVAHSTCRTFGASTNLHSTVHVAQMLAGNLGTSCSNRTASAPDVNSEHQFCSLRPAAHVVYVELFAKTHSSYLELCKICTASSVEPLSIILKSRDTSFV